MTVKITKSHAEGSIKAPPSKSMAHRALICGALSKESRICNLADSDDIKATLGCLETMGARIKRQGNDVVIGGLDSYAIPADSQLDCNESGSTLRFLLPLAMLCNRNVTFFGSERLLARPLSIYENISKEQGINFQVGGRSVTVCGTLKSGVYDVAGDVSSQFISGLLFALPLLEGDSVINVTGNFESASYIDLTLSALKDFGVNILRDGNKFYISGNQDYISTDYTVEGDCSNAAFLDAFNLIGGKVSTLGLDADTLQGDRIYKEFYKDIKLGADTFDISDCPDLGPVMFAVSAALGGGHKFTGTRRLKLKESDRAVAMAEELKKFGTVMDVYEDEVYINPCNITTPTEPLCGHNDHRIVMSLAILCSITGGEIMGAEAVKKSYPTFFEDIKSLGIGIV